MPIRVGYGCIIPKWNIFFKKDWRGSLDHIFCNIIKSPIKVTTHIDILFWKNSGFSWKFRTKQIHTILSNTEYFYIHIEEVWMKYDFNWNRVCLGIKWTFFGIFVVHFDELVNISKVFPPLNILMSFHGLPIHEPVPGSIQCILTIKKNCWRLKNLLTIKKSFEIIYVTLMECFAQFVKE